MSMYDLFYYTKWNCDDILSAYDGSNGYLILRPWNGGINNIRMSLELAVCIAYLSNKTLVLPPKYHIPALRDDFGYEDLFDILDMGITTIPLTEFAHRHNIEPTFEAVQRIAVTFTDKYEFKLLNFTESIPTDSFRKNREIVDLHLLCMNEFNVFFDTNLLGNFYIKIFSHKLNELKRLVARHVHFKPELFHTAEHAIRLLGTYAALHVRRDDFQYTQWWITAEQILANIRSVIPEGSTLYIATDHTDMTFFTPFTEYYKPIFYNDITFKFPTPPHYNHIPIIEQLICSRATTFVGTEWSTLSTYVYRLRGYMDDITDTNYYVNTKSYPMNTTFIDDTNSMDINADWKREYPDVWNF